MLGQENKNVFIESNVENSDKSLVLYKHNNIIDTFRIYVSKNNTNIYDYKFNIDSTICTIIFKEKDLGYSIGSFNMNNNWMPKSLPSLGNGYHWNIIKDTLIQSGSLPKLISFDKIQIKDGTSYTNRKTHERIKTVEKYYYLRFDENDNLIETSIE